MAHGTAKIQRSLRSVPVGSRFLPKINARFLSRADILHAMRAVDDLSQTSANACACLLLAGKSPRAAVEALRAEHASYLASWSIREAMSLSYALLILRLIESTRT